jgi:uncharacterized membrane protein YheB (UPF0754 family)
MHEWLAQCLASSEFLGAASIPVIAALIGWSTNWLAIKLTFYPIDFVGKPPFLGWQGVVPRKRHKMAQKLVDNTLSRVSNVRELYQEMNPQQIERHLLRHLQQHLNDYIDELMHDTHPALWENLPRMARNKVYADAHRQLPETLHGMMREVDQRIDELVDVRTLVINQLAADKTLLNRVFQECGQKEFDFIIRSGAWLGFLFGLLQLALWQQWQALWLLPLFGFIVGACTNWVALNIIFKPLDPIGIGPFRLQGLFLQRQKEVSNTFGRIVAHELLTTRLFAHAMFYGVYQARTRALAHKHIRRALDGNLITRTLAQVTLGFRGYSELKDEVAQRALQVSLQPLQEEHFSTERAGAIQSMIGQRLQGMSSAEFQDVLRPVFQEDEWILIAIGGFLGVLAGLLQILCLA